MTPEVYPEGYKVLIEVVQAEKVTSGGIIVPDTARDVKQRAGTEGWILRMGPTANVNFGDKKPEGAKIIFSKYGGFNIDLPDFGDRDFRIINDEDVLAVIGGEDG